MRAAVRGDRHAVGTAESARGLHEEVEKLRRRTGGSGEQKAAAERG